VTDRVPGRDEAAAGWLAHLRSGGTTTWSAYRETGTPAAPDRATPPPVPKWATGAAIATIGLALLALLLNSDQPLAIAGMMIIVGLGIGLVMQVMVLAAQNGAAYADLGVATSSVTFLRQIGASLGVAIVGAVLLSAGALEPAAAAQTLAARMPLVIGLMAPLVGLAFLLLLALPVIPLRETAYVTEEAR